MISFRDLKEVLDKMDPSLSLDDTVPFKVDGKIRAARRIETLEGDYPLPVIVIQVGD